MLPTDLNYLAQERCKELRGEIREPSTPFFEISFKKMFKNLFSGLGNKTQAKPSLSKNSRAKTY
jgi:hypothetical protein